MSKKTKAEKIAAALRAQRITLHASSVAAPLSDTQKMSPVRVQQAVSVNVKIQHQHTQDTGVYEPKDLRKTIVVTLFVVALLALVYVFQYKGYF